MREMGKITVMVLVAIGGLALALTSDSVQPRSTLLPGVEPPASSAGGGITPEILLGATPRAAIPVEPSTPAMKSERGEPRAPTPRTFRAVSTSEAAPAGSTRRETGVRPLAPPPTPSGAAARASASPGSGPLLSQTWYARFAYQLYPGSPSADAERALTGFQLMIRPASPTTVEMTLYNLRDDSTQHAIYDNSYRLYFVDSEGDDDGVGGETDDSDDIFIVTDAAGHILASSGLFGAPSTGPR